MSTALNQDYINYPERLAKFVYSHPGESLTLEEFLMMMGKAGYKSIRKPRWDHARKSWRVTSVGVNANVPSPGANADITWVVPAADHVNDGTGIMFRQWDTVEFPNGIQGTVTAINTTTPNAFEVTVGAQAGVTYPALTAGVTRLIRISNSMPEGSSPITSISSDLTGVSFQAQTIRDDHEITGRGWNSAAAWVEFNGRDVWYLTDLDDLEHRFKRAKTMAILNQDPNQVPLPSDPSQTFMTGMIPWIIANGNEVNYGATWGLQQLRDMINLFDAQKTGQKDYFIMSGLPLRQKQDDLIRTSFPNGAITYGSSEYLKGALLNLNFKGISLDGYSFQFGLLDEFTNPQGLGTTGFPYKDYGLVIPMGQTTTASTGTIDLMNLYYLADNNDSRADKITWTGWGGPKKDGSATDGVDRVKFHRLCDMGTRWVLPEAWGIFRQ